MPKTNINDETCPGWRVEVSWRPNNDEHSPKTPGHVQVASVNQHSELVLDGSPFDGWRVTLDRPGIDRMITALCKARDAAYPEPALNASEGCLVCGNPGPRLFCPRGTSLTRAQWHAHFNREYEHSLEYGASKTNAVDYAEAQTTKTYGPEPSDG